MNRLAYRISEAGETLPDGILRTWLRSRLMLVSLAFAAWFIAAPSLVSSGQPIGYVIFKAQYSDPDSRARIVEVTRFNSTGSIASATTHEGKQLEFKPGQKPTFIPLPTSLSTYRPEQAISKIDGDLQRFPQHREVLNSTRERWTDLTRKSIEAAKESQSVAKERVFVTKSGVRYHGVSFGKIDEDGFALSHAEGLTRMRFSDLGDDFSEFSPDVREELEVVLGRRKAEEEQRQAREREEVARRQAQERQEAEQKRAAAEQSRIRTEAIRKDAKQRANALSSRLSALQLVEKTTRQELASFIALNGEPQFFYVIQQLPSDELSKHYEIKIHGGIALLVTTDTSFQSEGRATMVLRNLGVVDVKLKNGFDGRVVNYQEVPNFNYARFKELNDQHSNAQRELHEATRSMEQLTNILNSDSPVGD